MVKRETQLLRQLARPHLDTDQISIVQALWHQGINGNLLVTDAERHGIAPLLYHHITQLDLADDQNLRRPLIALKIRHQKSNQARQLALEEILALFTSQNIRTIVLKGGALMHTLYADIALRPMGDLDILVPENQAQQAQSCLVQLHYRLHENLNPYLRDHHHLPMASKQVDDTAIHVEIHTDALSRDVDSSMCFDSLQDEPAVFQVGAQTTYSLGHIDMLRHLCHHTLEPVDQIKLIAVADIYGYATRYRDDIDLQVINSRFPFVYNTLQLFHYLAPLPESLHSWITKPVATPPSGIGSGFTPLSKIIESDQSVFAKLRHVLVAPAWWLHCYYKVAPDQQLWSTRLLTHPMQVAKWVFRRWRIKHRTSENV